jgi:hypothetical protein
MVLSLSFSLCLSILPSTAAQQIDATCSPLGLLVSRLLQQHERCDLALDLLGFARIPNSRFLFPFAILQSRDPSREAGGESYRRCLGDLRIGSFFLCLDSKRMDRLRNVMRERERRGGREFTDSREKKEGATNWKLRDREERETEKKKENEAWKKLTA